MIGISLFPTICVDLVGSGLAIVLSFLALRYASYLVKLQPENFLWGFLFYFSIALSFFAISRGIGHILRNLLVLSGNQEIWQQLSPFSGGFNTLLMISVSSVTIYYNKSLAAYTAIRREAKKLSYANSRLEETAGELQRMNTYLEEMVEERTRDLSESETKFRHFFENSKDMVYFCGRNGELSDINPSGLKMLGYDAPPPDFNLLSFFKDHETLERYLDSLSEKGFVSDFEMELVTRDGRTRHMLLTATAIRDAEGRMTGCEGIAKDMTRLRTITEQLISQEKMATMGQMAAGVAHEINTPLGVILGYAQLMMDDFKEGDEEYESLTVIERQTKACRKIVADLLKFSRQSDSAKKEIDLNEIIEEVLSVSEHNLNISHIQVIRKISPDLPPVIGDAEKLRQVFVNLLNNAHHAMEEGGEIVISTEVDRATGQVVATVRDTGCGIGEEIKSKIFDPFFTTKEVGKGTGLGLSVTYGIIQNHQGTISVESPVKNRETGNSEKGAAFQVRLPVAPPEGAAIPTEGM